MTLRLSQQQIEALAERRFERRIVQYIGVYAGDGGDAVADQAQQRALLEQIAKARAYGLTTELDIARFVLAAWTMGARFDTEIPALTEVLSTDRLTPTQKSEAVERVCVAILKTLQDGSS